MSIVTSVGYWRIYCITEGQFVYGYLPAGTDCTVCFNNNEHTTNPNSISLIDQISPNTTIIATQEPGVTNGIFKSKRKKMTCAASTVTSQFTTFPYTVNILAFYANISTANVGDMFELSVSTSSPIGVLTAAMTAGDIIIALPSSVMAYFQISYFPVFINHTNAFTEEGPEIIAVDRVNNTITLASGIVNSFGIGDYIKFKITRIESHSMNVPFVYSIGNYLRASPFVTGLKAELRYTNNSSDVKDFLYGIDFLV